MVFAPNVASSYRLSSAFKLRGSIGYGFRIPTYTDLYYSDPTTIGNPNLQAESAWSGEGGFDWTPGTRFSFSATGFDSQQHNTIDYVRASAADRWQATNLNGLSFKGVETSATIALTRTQELQLDWTNLYGAQSALHGLQSEYIFNYPVENAHMLWTMNVHNRLRVRNSLQVEQRYQQTPYPVWDLAFEYDAGARQKWRPYLRLANLSNTGYQEIEGVAMPGRSITGGVTFLLSSR
jgi:iron complex outermembrane receptor protein